VSDIAQITNGSDLQETKISLPSVVSSNSSSSALCWHYTDMHHW